jgi:acyl-CoA synthetase (AMP-forming)/AMP-acid ligase II
LLLLNALIYYKGTWKFEELEKFNSTKLDRPYVDIDDPLSILFTSGTTGRPKGAVLSHFNLINSTYLEITVNNMIEQNSIVCCPIPVFHVFGLIVGGLSPLIFGGKGK